jgi:D-3-phosphoglycerate dehydrogenase / 2-oxoglutarate reductase
MTNRGRRCFANRRETVQLPLKPGTPMKIYYLNPPYADLSIENEVLEGTGIELVPATVQSEQDVISLTQEAAATLTAHVPINAGIADHLWNCRIIVRLGVGYDIIDIESCKNRNFGL